MWFLNDEQWRDSAACTKSDPEIFFPPRDKAKYNLIAEKARAYCFGTDDTPACPVRNECLWYAVNLDEQHGIWGGLSHRERNARVRKWHRDYRHEMTLEEYILTSTEGKYGGSKNGPTEVPGR